MSKAKIFSCGAVALVGLLFVVLYFGRDREESSLVETQDVQSHVTSTTEVTTKASAVIQQHVMDKQVETAIKTEKKKTPTITSCDFPSMQKYLSAILSEPAWKDILAEYPLQQYKNIEEDELDVFVNGYPPRACVLELTLSSGPFGYTEFDTLQYPHYVAVPHVLSLLNPLEDYLTLSFSFTPNNSAEFVFLAADGPNVGSFSTYQFNEASDTIRLFTVSAGTKREKSAYEVIEDEEMCPCEQVFTIRMTDEVPVSEFTD